MVVALLLLLLLLLVLLAVVAGMAADWTCCFPLPLLLRLRRRLRLRPRLLRIAVPPPLVSRLAGNSKGPQTPDTPMACPSRA